MTIISITLAIIALSPLAIGALCALSRWHLAR